MIYKDGKEISGIHAGRRAVSYVYKGARLVWQAIRSCFGAGYWANEKPWSDGEGWKN